MSKEKRNEYMRHYNKEYRRLHPQQHLEYQRTFVLSHPWYKHYRAINARCNYANHHSFANYGGRGIRNYLTLDDMKELWFRDKAYEMKKPSVDRIDNDGDYTMRNCHFIELKENVAKNKFISNQYGRWKRVNK